MKVVVAVLATVLVVGVGSVEAARLVTGATIKDNSVTGKDIKNGSLTLSDLKASVRSALRGPAGPAGPAGLQGAQGAQGAQGVPGASGANGVTDITYVDSGEVNVPADGSEATALAVCPGDRVPTGASGGGGTSTNVAIHFVYVGSEGGFVAGFSLDGAPGTIEARVACAKK